MLKSSNYNTKLNDLFHICCGSSDKTDLQAILKFLWPILDNSLGIIDIASIYNLIATNEGVNKFDYNLFHQLFNNISKLKYSNFNDSLDKLLDDIRNARGMKIKSSNQYFLQLFDDNIIKELIKYDVSLKQLFASFIGNNIKFGGGISWKEVKLQSLSMDVDIFKQFVGSFSLTPLFGSLEEFEIKFKEILNDFPLHGSAITLNTSILFPQFQLLLTMLALSSEPKESTTQFAPKIQKNKTPKDKLNKFFIDIGIDRKVDKLMNRSSNADNSVKFEEAVSEPLKGNIMMPQSTIGSLGMTEHNRQSMLLKLEQLFYDIVEKIEERTGATLPNIEDVNIDERESKIKLLTKPVVIGDSLPLPLTNNDEIDTLLSSSLSNHNSNNYEDALKYIETARLQLNDNISDNILLYILISKGNVYRSCGDDELALSHYLNCWNIAFKNNNKDWEIISLNSIGVLAYFNIYINVALLCFNIVAQYREATYGIHSVDTATGWNNQGCCLYLTGSKGEARTKFEKSWNTICDILGQRSPRAVTVWKNLEKARRSHASKGNNSSIESVTLRPDVDRLIIGGKFTIKAFPPPLVLIKNSKKSKKSSKKKKKK